MSNVTYMELIARGLILAAGIGVFVHYFLMANFMQRAPHLVRAVLLPLSTFGGVGMFICGLTGNMLGGLLSSGLAVSAVIAVNLAAWSVGSHVSSAFEERARTDAEKTNVILHNITAHADGIGLDVPPELLELPVITPAGWREIDASDERAAWREGDGAR